MLDDPDRGLKIADYCCLASYTGIMAFEIFIVIRYLIPLRIKSPYILMFYALLTVVLVSSIIEIACRRMG